MEYIFKIFRWDCPTFLLCLSFSKLSHQKYWVKIHILKKQFCAWWNGLSKRIKIPYSWKRKTNQSFNGTFLEGKTFYFWRANPLSEFKKHPTKLYRKIPKLIYLFLLKMSGIGTYFERCLLACARLLAKIHLHFVFRQNRATLPFFTLQKFNS